MLKNIKYKQPIKSCRSMLDIKSELNKIENVSKNIKYKEPLKSCRSTLYINLKMY